MRVAKGFFEVVGALIFTVILFKVCYSMAVEQERGPTAKTGSPAVVDKVEPAEPPMQPQQVFAKELLNIYRGNELKGDSLYRGKYLRVVGRVYKVERILGDIIVLLDDNGGFDTVHCYLPESEAAAAMELKRGQQAIIDGTCGGAMSLGSVKIENARIR